MSKRRTQWNREKAHQVVDELQRSGLTVAEFARNHDLHPKRIRVWRKRFEQEATQKPRRMVELVPVAAAASPIIYSLKLHCPSGHLLEVAVPDLTEGVRALLNAVPPGASC